ncbi:alpha-N-acetylgalactosamine-specific lectin-like isoform X2 [Branchiostoma lanceolatum]|uniref:alpha-N-acetylgalactosamine-specific lectin-like isoform X2 n=1 Tax=Branchiostoma lanceolatum TaxID=7740 RepID=UPI0034527E53
MLKTSVLAWVVLLAALGGTTPCQPGQICEDFDECAAGTDDCGQNTVCVNDFGGFHCECKPGYYPNPDGKSCRDCPSGYRRYRDDCYRFWGGKNAKTYSGARQVCQENGGDIYMWKSAAAVARLKRKLVSNDAPSVWIGLSDENPEGTWIWADGMVLGGSDFINWSPDPPHNTDRKDCAVARKVHRYRWKAVPCSYRRAFICHSLRAP